MGWIRFSMLKSLSNSVRKGSKTMPFQGSAIYRDYMRISDQNADVRALCGYGSRGYHVKPTGEMSNLRPPSQPGARKSMNFSGFPHTILNSCVRSNFHLVPVVPMLTYNSYSSVAGDKGDSHKGQGVPEASGTDEYGISNGNGVLGGDWEEKLKNAWHSVVDVVTIIREKAKESSEELIPYTQQLLDSHPYLRDIVVPVGGTLVATWMAWLVMPRLLKRFHKYSQQGRATLLSGNIVGGEVPYEKSLWGALEDPVRYLFTFISVTQIAMVIAPNAIAVQYVSQGWRSATVLSFLWFLYRWKTNVISRALASQSMHTADKESLLTLDKVASVGLFFLGLTALAEACGVAVHSILTVGGIGGVATAFAAKDILGNVLSGLSMQFSRPFSLGDTIKAGSLEGQVVEMGLTTTLLLNAEKFPVIVPNSMFSSQVIVNKSRAQWRAFVSKIPLQFYNLEKMPQISDEIVSMLKSNPNVFLGKEAPYCFLSQIGSYYAEVTLGCNLKPMSKDEWYSTEQDILLQSVQIIKQHGVMIGTAWQTSNGT